MAGTCSIPSPLRCRETKGASEGSLERGLGLPRTPSLHTPKMEPEHPAGCAFSVPASAPSPRLSPAQCRARQAQLCLLVPTAGGALGLTGRWTPHEERGGDGVGRSKTTEALLANSKDSWEGITHVLIYSTSSITLLLLLTPGDLFNCFKSQYCHFIIPRLPLLLIKKEKEGEEEAA